MPVPLLVVMKGLTGAVASGTVVMLAGLGVVGAAAVVVVLVIVACALVVDTNIGELGVLVTIELA